MNIAMQDMFHNFPIRSGLLFTIVAGFAALLAGCGSFLDDPEPVVSNPRLVEYGEPVPRGGGIFKVGNPYQIAGRWYYPKEDESYDETGIASWYGLDFHGRRTANGEIYDMDALSAAHPTLPLPTYARVTNLSNNREIIVRINDRGPYAHDRIIDLSKNAAEALDFSHQGTTRVRVTYLGRAPLNGDDSWETRLYQRTRGEPGSTQGVSLPRNQNVRTASAQQAQPRNPDITGSLGGQHFVQAGSFREQQSAQRLQSRLSSVGSAFVTTANVGEITYYRVRVGPYGTRDAADASRQRIESMGIQGPRLVSTQ